MARDTPATSILSGGGVSGDGVSGWSRATDERVLLGVAQHDEEALVALYDRYGHRAFGLALRVLGERGAAEDVVQDAFMNIWHRAVSFQPGRGSVGRWLLSIVQHRAIDRLRGRSGHARQEMPLEQFDRVLMTDDPWHEVDLLLRRDELKQWLALLPEVQRVTLELAYFEGHTQGEIATMMGVPLGTVKARSRMGLQKLRERADERGQGRPQIKMEPRTVENMPGHSP